MEIISYSSWLAEFCTDKTFLLFSPYSDSDVLHSIVRYVDENKSYWEIGRTEDGGFAIRIGKSKEDEETIDWCRWNTLPDIGRSIA